MFNLSPSVLRLVIALSFSSFVNGDTRNWNPTGEGCVDPSGFLSCYSAQSDNAVQCANFCTSSEPAGSSALALCETGCYGAWLAGNVGCWIQSCWNQVYSCEYQLTAISYFDGTGLIQNYNIPFYPPPDNVSAGACSCNLGYVYGNQTYIPTNDPCIAVAGTGDFTQLYNCDCCENGFPASNILNICPSSDLSVVGFPTWLATYQALLAKYTTDNCAILDNGPDTCISSYDTPFYGTKVYNPLALPSGVPGTQPLSNTPGNAFTEFGASSYTLTLFPGYSSVITPAAFNNKAAAATGSVGTGSNALSASPSIPTTTAAQTGKSTAVVTTGKSTGTSTAASASATKSAGERSVGTGFLFRLGLVFVMTIAFAS